MSRTKTREMVEGPTAFETFKRLMSRLLAVPKAEIAEQKVIRKRNARVANKSAR